MTGAEGSDGDRSSGRAAKVPWKEAEVGLHGAKRLKNGRFAGSVPTGFPQVSSLQLVTRRHEGPVDLRKSLDHAVLLELPLAPPSSQTPYDIH